MQQFVLKVVPSVGLFLTTFFGFYIISNAHIHRLLLEDHFTLHTGIFTVETHRTQFLVLCQAKLKIQRLLSVVEVKITF